MVVSKEQLADWRCRCEERIARRKAGRYTPEWSLDVPETSALLDMVRDLQGEVQRYKKGLVEVSEILPCEVRCRPQTECGECHALMGGVCCGCIARDALGEALLVGF